VSIGETIRRARDGAGVSLEVLAERLGVSVQTLDSWERDEGLPETEKLRTIGWLLGFSPDLMTAGEGDRWLTILQDRDRVLERAIAFAAVKHSGALRKGSNTPYIVHPMEVAAIVSGLTDDVEVIAAAVLHDVLENTDTTRQELDQLFGQRIVGLVADESENKRSELPAADTWRIRKAESICHLEQACHEARVIALGDKLANIRSIERDYEVLGDALWQRFNQKDKASHAWYYDSILRVLEEDTELADTALLLEYASRVRCIFGDVLEADEPDAADEPKLPIRCFYRDAMADVYAAMPEGAKAWALIMDRPADGGQEALQTMAMIYDAFLRSEKVGFADTHLVLTNDPDGEDIEWGRLPGGYAIHLCAASTANWCQVGYQLGYAMLHCLIDHLHPDYPAVCWAEELICEAGTLALLSMLAERWEETPFGHKDAEYASAIREYIDNCLSDRGTSALSRCPDRETLERLNDDNDFDDRLNESHDLFSRIGEGDLLRLANVREYAADRLLLLTHYWRNDAGRSQAVDYICRLQEQIPECELPIGVPIDINLWDSQPSMPQRELYAGMIRAMRPLPYEYIIFEFMDSDKGDCEQIGLVFYQVTRERDGRILAEIRLDTRDGRRMYRLYCDDDVAVGILGDILSGNPIRDLSHWEDITDTVFSGE